MKMLSVQQPWASLIVHGRKTCELRSWSTQYRGRLAIHAARRFLQRQRRQCMEEPLCAVLAALGIHRLAELPRGCIIGLATLVECVPASEVVAEGQPLPHGLSKERRGSEDYRADFAWLLADPIALAEPLECVGQLGLCAMPAALAARLSSASQPKSQEKK